MLGASSDQVSFRRTRELLRDGANGVVFVCPSIQTFRLDAGSGDDMLAPGHVGVWDQTRAGEMRNLDRNSATLVHICRENLGRAVRDLERKLAEAKHKPIPMAALLRDYASLAVEHRPKMDAAQASLAAQHLVDMAALILGQTGDLAREAQLRGARAAWLERVKADVMVSHAMPGYSIHHAVARLKISERYVQLLFEQTGETFSDYLLEQRLQSARRMLTSPGSAGRKIVDIAQASGFGDLSYFHRRFRRRFGVTPAELRAETEPPGT